MGPQNYEQENITPFPYLLIMRQLRLWQNIGRTLEGTFSARRLLDVLTNAHLVRLPSRIEIMIMHEACTRRIHKMAVLVAKDDRALVRIP